MSEASYSKEMSAFPTGHRHPLATLRCSWHIVWLGRWREWGEKMRHRKNDFQGEPKPWPRRIKLWRVFQPILLKRPFSNDLFARSTTQIQFECGENWVGGAKVGKDVVTMNCGCPTMAQQLLILSNNQLASIVRKKTLKKLTKSDKFNWVIQAGGVPKLNLTTWQMRTNIWGKSFEKIFKTILVIWVFLPRRVKPPRRVLISSAMKLKDCRRQRWQAEFTHALWSRLVKNSASSFLNLFFSLQKISALLGQNTI